MKTIIMTLTALFSVSALAGTVQSAEYYALDTWMGEYPNGYQINKDVKVPAVASPENPTKVGECTLKAKSVIHVWAQKTKSEFVTLTGITKYQAQKQFELLASDSRKIQVKAGDIITELSYLAEGQCLMSVSGQSVTDTCLTPSNGEVRVLSTSAFPTVEYFKTTCKEGSSAWISAGALTDLTEDSNSGVTAAEIIEYGKIKEP